MNFRLVAVPLWVLVVALSPRREVPSASFAGGAQATAAR